MSKLGLEYNNKANGYYIEPASEKTFFPDRQANLYVLGKKCGVRLLTPYIYLFKI